MAEQSGTGSAEGLDRVLADLRALSEDIESCAVLSDSGELLSSSHTSEADRERVAGMLAAIASLSERAARENGKDHTSQVRVDAQEGHFLMVRIEGGGALAATTGPDARVGLVLYDMRNSRGEVEKVLQEGSPR
ncbi:MAG: roadblock/LC7 domain-containing protein [Rubrobacter sp.]